MRYQSVRIRRYPGFWVGFLTAVFLLLGLVLVGSIAWHVYARDNAQKHQFLLQGAKSFDAWSKTVADSLTH